MVEGVEVVQNTVAIGKIEKGSQRWRGVSVYFALGGLVWGLVFIAGSYEAEQLRMYGSQNLATIGKMVMGTGAGLSVLSYLKRFSG